MIKFYGLGPLSKYIFIGLHLRIMLHVHWLGPQSVTFHWLGPQMLHFT